MKDDADKPPLEYEQRASAQLQRQYRRLMALALLNTILLAGFIVGPSVGPMIKTQWQQFQARREQRQLLAAQQADLRTAKTYTAPADCIVYEENPDEAAKLLAQPHSLYHIIHDARVNYFPPHPWQPPVEMWDPNLPGTVIRGKNTTVFLHERTAPSGARRLIRVSLDAAQSFSVVPYDTRPNPIERRYEISTRRGLFPQLMGDDGAFTRSRALLLGRDRPNGRVFWTRTADGDFEHGQVTFDVKHLYRIYAGQADEKDPSHFTIDYELDGVGSTIDGYLRDDMSVDLIPRTGATLDRDAQGTIVTWDPTTAPTTTQRAR